MNQFYIKVKAHKFFFNKKVFFFNLGVEGEDVVTLLQEALNRRGDVKIEICAILNDTTG